MKLLVDMVAKLLFCVNDRKYLDELSCFRLSGGLRAVVVHFLFIAGSSRV